MQSDNEIVSVDLFCGAGGFSEALRQACNELGYSLRHAAINHDEAAIETHSRNHPDADQYHSKVEQLHPPNVIKSLVDEEISDVHTSNIDVDLLLAGPECTHFSSARGGKPVSEQKRMSPWEVLDWLEKLDVEAFIIENVGEIQDWGPVDDGQPTKDGSIFDAWINALNQLGYSVNWTVLNAADFGDPTSRERFFLIGRQTGEATFPEPTHAEDPDPNGDRLPWRTAAEIIDWSDLGSSIWTRDLTEKRVHSPPKNSTMRRIAKGIRRHCDDRLEPFADVLEQIGNGKEDEPTPYTVQELRERVVPHECADVVADAVDEPFLVTVPDRLEMAESMILRQQDGAHPTSVSNRPVSTISTRGAHAIATPATRPLLMPKNGSQRGLHSNPLYLPEERPHHTITSDPRSTIVTPSLFTPFIDDYEGPAAPIDNPVGTITSRGRFALCIPELWPWGLDVKYRMLQPRELKQAQGFPVDYEIAGTKTERTSQIGNAVPVHLAKALCKHLLTATDPGLSSYGGGFSADPDPEIPNYEEVAATDD